MAVLAAHAMLVGCGGGGSGGSTPTQPPDARNGDYTAYAADARSYTLSLNFDAGSYRVQGNGLDQTGTIGTDSLGQFFASPSVTTGTSTARLQAGNDSVVGGLRLGEGVLPFIAARSFVTTVAEAVGTYNFLGRTVSAGAAANTSIFTGEITAGGQLRTCNDNIITVMAQCPTASVVSGTLTIAGTEFLSTTATGAIPFRIARIGAGKVLLRGSASTESSRRFWVGLPNTAVFTAGVFSGVNTDGNASLFSLSNTGHTATVRTASGQTLARSGVATPLVNLPAMLRLATTSSGGDYFAIRGEGLAVICAVRDSATMPGFFEIGRAP